MYQAILMIHVFAAVCIIALVLVQQGKGATTGAAFGGGASATVFGSRGSGSFLFRMTISFVAIFFLTSIGMNYMATKAFKQERVVTLPAAPHKTNAEVPAMPAPEQIPVTQETQAPAEPVIDKTAPAKQEKVTVTVPGQKKQHSKQGTK